MRIIKNVSVILMKVTSFLFFSGYVVRYSTRQNYSKWPLLCRPTFANELNEVPNLLELKRPAMFRLSQL